MTQLDPLEGKAALAVQPPPEATIVAFDGAVRSSKTVASLLMWVEFVSRLIRTKRGGALAMVGRTEASIIRNAVEPLQQWLGPSRVVLNRGLGIVTILGREVYLFGANDVSAVTKIQGLTLVGIYIDEAANVPEVFFNMARSRLSALGAMMFLTLNPEGPKHWVLTKWLKRARWWIDAHGKMHEKAPTDTVMVPNDQGVLKPQPVLNLWRVTFLLDDNTWLVRNNPAFVAELRSSYPKGSVFHQRYIESKWVSAEGSVYPMWNEDTMTVDLEHLPPVEMVYMAGLDYGTTHSTRAYLLGLCRFPTDAITGQLILDPSSTRERGMSVPVLVILDEYAPESATVAEHATGFLQWLERNAHYGRPDWIAIDSAAATFKVELFDRGLDNVMGAFKAVVPGIQLVQSLLTAQRLVVVRERCHHLIQMLPEYMWDTKATDRGETKPVKENDDEADALRYVVYTSWSSWRHLIPLAGMVAQPTEDE